MLIKYYPSQWKEYSVPCNIKLRKKTNKQTSKHFPKKHEERRKVEYSELWHLSFQITIKHNGSPLSQRWLNTFRLMWSSDWFFFFFSFFFLPVLVFICLLHHLSFNPVVYPLLSLRFPLEQSEHVAVWSFAVVNAWLQILLLYIFLIYKLLVLQQANDIQSKT